MVFHDGFGQALEQCLGWVFPRTCLQWVHTGAGSLRGDLDSVTVNTPSKAWLYILPGPFWT